MAAATAQALPGPPAAKAVAPQVNREQVCPFLLRVFPMFGGHHRIEDYPRNGDLPTNELQMYTWKDATMRELTDLVKTAQPAARRTGARLEFALVYPDKRGRNVMRQVAVTNSTRPGPDDTRTLEQLQFQIGDYLDVAIL